MSTLALVRHAQASFFAENYDQLSPLGEQQARLLGEYWVRRGVRFDEVYTGPRVRQIETAALAGEAFVKAGLPWPEPTFLTELDEHQVDRLIKLAMHDIARQYPNVGRLHADYQKAELPHDKNRSFQLMFEEVVHGGCLQLRRRDHRLPASDARLRRSDRARFGLAAAQLLDHRLRLQRRPDHAGRF